MFSIDKFADCAILIIESQTVFAELLKDSTVFIYCII